jgi:hypothetical protein
MFSMHTKYILSALMDIIDFFFIVHEFQLRSCQMTMNVNLKSEWSSEEFMDPEETTLIHTARENVT